MKVKRLRFDEHSSPTNLTTLPMTTNTMGDTSILLALPKELVFQIITHVAISTCNDNLYPQSVIELSKCNYELNHLIHHDPWRLNTLWPSAFHDRFDTRAIYRRRLHGWDWQKVMKLRCKALYACKAFADHPTCMHLLDRIRWEIIWDMITEHDERNMSHILDYKVHVAAVSAYQLDQYRDRQLFPVVLPILSLLVNYDFSITSHFRALVVPDSVQIVSTELSRFAYNFEAADSLITKHMPLRPFHASAQHINETPSDDELPLTFYPALDAPAAALHLFFATFFASHPSLYSAIPGCVPIPLFQISSDIFDVEYLRRYERNLFINAHIDDEARQLKRPWTESVTTLPCNNIYSDSGFASASHFVSEARHITGDWLGYYSFVDPEENVATEAEDWFDGPMRLSLWIVPLDDVNNTSSTLISTSTAATVAASSSSLAITLSSSSSSSLASSASLSLSSSASSTSSALSSLSSRLSSSASSSSALFSSSASASSASSPPAPPAFHMSAIQATSFTGSWPSRWSNADDKNNRDNRTTQKRRKHTMNRSTSDSDITVFPRMHLQECPLTKFEGTGMDNLGSFTVMGLIDDTEDGQVTWEKTYVDSGETWEYSGKFALPMGICGRWGDEDYGGPWWIWKTSDGGTIDSVSGSSLNIK
ncbi:unnamed protein product [Absidia cylindrospora]